MMRDFKPYHYLLTELNQRKHSLAYNNIWQRLHIEPFLLFSLALIATCGLLVLYSAAGQDISVLTRQCVRFGAAFGLMFILAQIAPYYYQHWAPFFYTTALLLLIAVLLIGHIGNGAQRWLNLGFFHFQPSELMKLAVPLMLAWYLDNCTLPPDWRSLSICAVIILLPTLLIAKQPDLGTALMIVSAGSAVLLLAGIPWRLIVNLALGTVIIAPFLWHHLHEYQRLRVLTFIDPERDPLRSGYHIIQSKIAIGSGGILGKGWLHGSQSHLHFLPEHSTDFIFALLAEEFGLVGSLLMIVLYLFVAGRGLYLATQAHDTFSRLLAGSVSLMFFFSAFINMGMVTGILPVVGLPLPLVSYGGTSMITLLAGFGILMSIHPHKRLVRT